MRDRMDCLRHIPSQPGDKATNGGQLKATELKSCSRSMICTLQLRPMPLQRAGSEITINDPKSGECRRWRSPASDAGQRRFVFVNDVGWYQSITPCAVNRFFT